MSYSEPARAVVRVSGVRMRVATVLVVVSVLGVIALQFSKHSSSQLSPIVTAPTAIGAQDGLVPSGVTVFDDEYPAVAKLDTDLRAALRRAALAAARGGVVLHVNSGWRSARYQQQLLRDATAKYGSAANAARWVATPETSAHVSGDAVDIGPTKAAAWLARHGAAYGLCPVYRTEPWHFELRLNAVTAGCPRMYADPTQDPRMRAPT